MGVRKGCYHCTKRRIRCDMAEPQCLKCIAKGLECSGNGLRYRFNDGIASRGKFRGASNPAVPNAQPPYLGKRKASPVLTSAGGREALTRRQCSGSTQQQHHLSGSEMMPWDCKARMAPVLEPINRRVEFLLNHFSTHMASGMVVLDGDSNGYRSLILPLATRDDLVQQAVTSVASLHLCRADPALRPMAENSRDKVIKLLQSASTAQEQANVFSISTWATVLVLLVGELAGAGDHYPYLLRMLCSLKGNAVDHSNRDLVQFLSSQTKLLALLAQPFMDASNNTANAAAMAPRETLEQAVLESQKHSGSPADYELISIVAEAARICSRIYSDRSRPDGLKTDGAVTQLMQVISQIPPDAAAANALVWVYFIGAADSDTVEQHDFFIERLVESYERSGWANIAAGLLVLELIWQRPRQSSSESWAIILPEISTTFVM